MVNNFGINSVMSDPLAWLGNKLNFWELKSELCEKHVQHWRLNVLFLDWEHLNGKYCQLLFFSPAVVFLSFSLWQLFIVEIFATPESDQREIILSSKSVILWVDDKMFRLCTIVMMLKCNAIFWWWMFPKLLTQIPRLPSQDWVILEIKIWLFWKSV